MSPNSNTRPESVSAYYKEGIEKSPERVRARFYLTKILHFLFPKNIPDVFFSSAKGLILEKMDVGDSHKRFHELLNKKDGRTPEETNEGCTLWEKIDCESHDSVFFNKLKDLIVFLDDSAVNFGKDQEGNINYVDNFDPWDYSYRGVSRGYDPIKLKELIDNLPDDSQEKSFSRRKKEMALNYFNKLEQLYQAEEIKFKQSRKQGDKNKLILERYYYIINSV